MVGKCRLQWRRPNIQRNAYHNFYRRENNDEEVIGLFFDGSKDQTLIQEKKGQKKAKNIIQEEHITVLKEPGSKHVSHLTPKSGSSEDIASELTNLIDSNNFPILAVGCDGTVVNTGHIKRE